MVNFFCKMFTTRANISLSEAWEPLSRYLKRTPKLIDVVRDRYPFHQQIKIFVCFLSGQFKLNEQSEKNANYANTLEGIFLIAPCVRGLPWGSDGPNRTQNESVNPCPLPWSSPILSLCPGKRRRQCAASRVFLISTQEKRSLQAKNVLGVLRKNFHGAQVPGIFDSFPV